MERTGRRKFIQTIILATGAMFTDWGVKANAQTEVKKKHPHVPGTSGSLDFHTAHDIFRDGKKSFTAPEPREKTGVVVIGGGISGLTAAWMLKKAGKEVIVLENEGVPGGMARRSAFGAVPNDLGAIRFIRADGIYKALYDDCGLVPLQLPSDGYFMDSTHILHDLYAEHTLQTAPPYYYQNRDYFRSFRNNLRSMDEGPTYPLSTANPEFINQYDVVDSSKFMENQGPFDLIDWLDIFSFATFGQGLRKVNAYALLATYRSYLGPACDSYTYTFREGMGALPEKLKALIGAERIREKTLAFNVVNENEGVRVAALTPAGEPYSIRAGAAIIATQKLVAAHLVPDLPGLQKEKMRRMPYAPVVTVQLRCSAPLLPARSFVTWIRDGDRRFSHVYDMTYVHDWQSGTLDRRDGEFYYAVQYSPPPIQMHALEDEPTLVQYAQDTVDALSDHLLDVYEKVKEASIYAWGHGLVTPEPGVLAALNPGVREHFGKIFFAGSDNDVVSLVESAIAAGVSAAEDARRVL